MKPGVFAAVIVAVFVLGFGVGRSSVTASTPASPPPGSMAGALSGSAEPPQGMGRMDPNDPAMAAAHPAGTVVTGVVDEVIQVPNYTYLRLKTSGGDEWAAVNATPDVTKGQSVVVVQATLMTNFASGTLKRTFERIWFGQLQGPGGAAPPMGAAPAMGGSPGNPHPASSATAGAMAAIQKAQGPLGLRVSDVFAERAALVGKTVRVKGKVTKVTVVQGVNYAHLKDGSGSAGGGDDDLTVATRAELKAEEVVTLEGTVAVNKDFGAGVRPLVLDDARVIP